MKLRGIGLVIFGWTLGVAVCLAQTTSAVPTKSDGTFAPFEQWKSMVLAGDAAGLKTLYSVNPVARIVTASGEVDADAAIHYWIGLKPRSMKVEVAKDTSPEAGKRVVLFQAEIVTSATGSEKTFYITEGQMWQQQGEQWRVLMSKRSEATRLQQPASQSKNVYPADADAHAEVKEALEKAGSGHKRVLVVFGANWCYDCHVLDLAFHREDIAPILEASFEVVHIDIGQGEKNQDLMKEYGVPVERGIPAVAVLDEKGKLLFSQKNGEFEKARALGPEDLVGFLNRWKEGGS
jgi:thioredoxin 1